MYTKQIKNYFGGKMINIETLATNLTKKPAQKHIAISAEINEKADFLKNHLNCSFQKLVEELIKNAYEQLNNK